VVAWGAVVVGWVTGLVFCWVVVVDELVVFEDLLSSSPSPLLCELELVEDPVEVWPPADEVV
jgi:hypothetical protein